MMKRMLSLLMLFCLLCSILPVQAEEDVYSTVQNALYRIVQRTKEGDVTIGSGILFLEKNLLLTAESCCREGNLYAIGEDGEYAILYCEAAGDSGAALMEMAAASSAEPLLLSNYEYDTLPYLFGADADDNAGAMPMYQLYLAMYRGQNALHVSGEEGLLPGAILADEMGQVVALVMGQQAEGIGMYTALESDSLYAALTGGGDTEAFLPMEIQWNGGMMNVTWQDKLRSSGLYYLTVSGEENYYYTSYENEPGNRTIELAVPPGHTYYLQVQWTESEQDAQPTNWNAMTIYTVPELPFRQYGFQQECYLACAPKGQEITEILPEMQEITAAALLSSNEARYLQVILSYDVEQEIDLPMTVSLIAPDGQFYYEEMLYLFSPEYEQNDYFALLLDDIFASCREFSESGTLPAGEYVLKYSISGRTAGEYAFILPEGE